MFVWHKDIFFIEKFEKKRKKNKFAKKCDTMENIEFILGFIATICASIWGIYKNRKIIKNVLKYIKKCVGDFISVIDFPRRMLARRMNSKDFMDWQDKILLKIYGDKYFTNIFDTMYPVYLIGIDGNYGFYEVNSLCMDENDEALIVEEDSNKLKLPDIYKTEIMTKGVEKDPEALKEELMLKRELMGTGRWWKGYNWFMARSMRDGNHIGFILSHINNNGFNKNAKIQKIHLGIGSYKLNLLTSHILTYELFKAYEKLKKEGKDVDNVELETLWPMIPFRRYIHYINGCFENGANVGNVLFSGAGRYAMLSVQCLVVLCTTEKGHPKYKTFFGKRSNSTHKVSTKLGCFQFPPSGGFDLYDEDDMDNIEVIKNSCLLNLALMREYLEEIFNIKKYAKVDKSNKLSCDATIGRVNDDPHTVRIKEMLDTTIKDNRFKKGTKQAYFTTVGANVDLIDLRLSVNFLLVINDYNYYKDNKDKFGYNEELDATTDSGDTQGCKPKRKMLSSLNYVEKELDGERKIVEDSVALYIQGKQAFEEYVDKILVK